MTTIARPALQEKSIATCSGHRIIEGQDRCYRCNKSLFAIKGEGSSYVVEPMQKKTLNTFSVGKVFFRIKHTLDNSEVVSDPLTQEEADARFASLNTNVKNSNIKMYRIFEIEEELIIK